MNTPEINELLRLTGENYGGSLKTTTDMEVFSLYLKKKGAGIVSPSTLKRLWGYVGDAHIPRTSTLDVLSRNLGHESFTRFCKWLRTDPAFNSSFFTAGQLASSSLEPGDAVTIGWSPNRLLRLEYLGENTYEVVESVNSKLLAGDRFETAGFINGTPLFLNCVMRDGLKTPPFIAGRNGGISCLEKIKSSK